MWYKTLLILCLYRVLEKQRSPNPAILQQPESAKRTQQKNTEKLGMSDASTVPVRRRLVWGEQEKKEQMENQSPAVKEEEGKETKQETAGAQKLEENDQEVNVEDKIEEYVIFFPLPFPLLNNLQSGLLFLPLYANIF